MGVETHAFLSQGLLKTTANDYLAKSKLGSFNFTEAGINFTKQLTDDLRMGVQLFARNLGATGNFNAKMDWFYLDYHWSDLLGLRFGRVKLPFGLYNDISDIDAARGPVLLPQSVYPIQNRDYLLAQSGMEIYGYSGSGPAGALDYRLYGGTIFLTITNTPGSNTQLKDLNIPYVAGGRVLWETPVEGLRIGPTLQALRLDSSFLFGSNPTPVSSHIPALLWVGSVEYVSQDLLLAAEYSRWHLQITDSSNPAVLPEAKVTSERVYGMASYRLNRWLQPTVYYSLIYPNTNDKHGRANQQHDLSATLRFDINRYWLIKLEGHYMVGTAGLDTTLNNNAPLSTLAERWGAFIVKTTAYF